MRISLFVAFISLLFWGCKKDYDGSGPQNPIYSIPIDTKLEGLTDIVMQQNSIYELPISVRYVSGRKEKVSIALTNMPEHVFVSITPQIDTPNYSSTLKFISENADTGTTTVTVTTVAEKEASTRTYSFNIKIEPSPVNYALDLVGHYQEQGACDNVGAVNHTAFVTAVPGYLNRIKIQNLWTGLSSYYLIADIDPTNHKVIINGQSNNGISYTGSGTYSDDQIDLHYEFTDGNLLKDNCTTILTR